MESLAQRLRHQSMDWLAQREYSRHELALKLQRRFFGARQRKLANGMDDGELPDELVVEQASAAVGQSQPLIDATLDWLEEQHFLSDERCTRLHVRSHIERGHGPLRIRQELLYQKRLGSELVEAELAASDCDWFALAEATLKKRFRYPPADIKEKARQLRFLQARGFTAEQCHHALNALQRADTQG
jgi:regulatory protein